MRIRPPVRPKADPIARRAGRHAVLLAGEATLHQQAWADAFATGLRRHGWTTEIRQGAAGCDLLVTWGVRRELAIAEQRRAGGAICVLERGYVGDRFHWTSVSFGGRLNGRATFRGPFDDRSRWDRLFAAEMRPWSRRRSTRAALVIGQVPTDAAVIGSGFSEWLGESARLLVEAGWLVRYRPHPGAPRWKPNGLPREAVVVSPDQPLDEALAAADLCVTWNSNSGVVAALRGVPVVAGDEGSMAWAVATHDVGEAVIRPDRTAWASRLAWCQWSADEMRSGEAWAACGGEDAGVLAEAA